jgi:hypothetical protein
VFATQADSSWRPNQNVSKLTQDLDTRQRIEKSLPRKPSTQRLFDANIDGWLNSTLHSGFIGWREYSYCYRRAADALTERFALPLDSPEAMFLPAVFLYRHAVEAALKGILVELGVRAGVKADVPTHHRILDTWRAVRPQVQALPGGLGEAWFNRAESLIHELNAIDPDSMHFRYPVSKSGVGLLPAGFTVDVKNIAAAIDDLFYVLDNVSGYLSAANDFEVDDDAAPA